MLSVIIVYVIGFISIILGFVALLRSTTYLDQNTQKVVEIEVPKLGKFKSNYPSIAFVIVGALLIYFTFNKSYPPEKVEWKISGSITGIEGRDVLSVDLILHPSETVISLYENGNYKIEIDLEKGQKLEDVFEFIKFSHKEGHKTIFLREELKAYEDDKPSLIQTKSDTYREYKPFEIKQD